MGVDYDTICFYGIYFTYDQLNDFISGDEFNKISDKIGSSQLSNIWCEMGNIVIHPFFNSQDIDNLYCLGVQLQQNISWYSANGIKIHPNKLDTWINRYKESVYDMIRSFCQRYSIEYTEPYFYIFPNFSK